MSSNKARVLVLVLFALLAVGAVSATTASAVQWLINGTAFAGSEKISAKVQIPGDLVTLKSILTGGATIIIGCTGIEALGGEINNNNKDAAAAIRFTTCKVDASGCVLSVAQEKEIKTSAVSSTASDLVAGKEPVFISFRSTAAEESFTTIVLSGCASEGSFKIRGVSSCQVLTASTSAVTKLCQFGSVTLLGSLHFGAPIAQIEGTVGFTLAGTNQGKPWSVNP